MLRILRRLIAIRTVIGDGGFIVDITNPSRWRSTTWNVINHQALCIFAFIVASISAHLSSRATEHRISPPSNQLQKPTGTRDNHPPTRKTLNVLPDPAMSSSDNILLNPIPELTAALRTNAWGIDASSEVLIADCFPITPEDVEAVRAEVAQRGSSARVVGKARIAILEGVVMVVQLDQRGFTVRPVFYLPSTSNSTWYETDETSRADARSRARRIPRAELTRKTRTRRSRRS